MNKALSNKLLHDFPQLFRNRQDSSLQRGFECGDGWFDLIYKLSQDIETIAHESGLDPGSPEWPLCRQVKQKFGSLRFVVLRNANFPDMYELISKLRENALERSLQICEYCGKPADIVADGGRTIMCPEHKMQAETAPDFPPPFQLGKCRNDE